jgi:two-component system, sensor histidine kinase
VLFAEDSVPTQFIVKRLIKRFGIIELVCVNDGKSALEHCEKCMKGNETIPDIILMDLQMPVMDGLESSRRIRKLGGEMSTVPIVAVSSGIKSMSQKDCVKAGMSDYVAKPLNQQLLTKILLDNLPQPLISSPP